ncbi:MerR family transcriptional regulator [Deinococcus pimensis]|uniref:MerR family transcriptional regulator n=1 Tax=Deinococcus pimensis TaxID=309888 RepID=UPI0004865242|nr:MerR family transcriptional regulator [Deinococcus pimensis]
MNETRRDHDLLSIGVFAREAKLTQKALRLYDALGLLTPARTDPDSGYRHYAREQLPRARLIALLRRLDMPLTRIAEVLDLRGEAAAAAVGAYWREVERGAMVRRRLVQYLETFLSGKGEHMYGIDVREVPEQHVLSLTRSLRVHELEDFIVRTTGDLYAMIARAGLRASRTSLAIYHGRVDEDNDGPVEICVGFEPHGEEAPRPGGNVVVKTLPAHREVYTTITKAQTEFPGILGAYEAVGRYVDERGLTCNDSSREVYFTTAAETADDDPFCDVAQPVE